MVYEKEDKTPVTGILGTTFGSVALAGMTGLLNGNGLFGGFNGNANGVSLALAQKEAEIASLRAEKYTDHSDALLRDSLLKNWLKPLADESAANKVVIATLQAEIQKNKEICDLNRELSEQKAATAQAVTNGAINSLMQQVHALECLTKIVIPAHNVCPRPMPMYNSWTDPTPATTATTPATA